MVARRKQETGVCGSGQRAQTSSYKMNTFWDGIYSMVTIVYSAINIYLKVARSVDLESSHQEKRKFVTKYSDG